MLRHVVLVRQRCGRGDEVVSETEFEFGGSLNFPLNMSDMDDYEVLPASASLSVTCAAGALAGVAEHCVMFPIDSVKVM